jgi:hypothetical protein
LRGRAEQLFKAITTAQVDASIWREQRALAETARDTGAVGDALAAYRERIDRLPTGDASGAAPLLDSAWARWEEIAARVGLARSEAVGCDG